MKVKKYTAVLAVVITLGIMSSVQAANENWRSPFVTRIMKVISQDSSYTDVVLTDLDRNGIPEAFVIRKGTYGGIGAGFTMVNNAVTDIEVPSNIIGECLENINVYIKNDTYIFVGMEVSRYTSNISYYKLVLDKNKLVATKINKRDVSPYESVIYVDKYSKNLLENGYPNRSKIEDFISSYDMVNSLSATYQTSSISVDGKVYKVGGYSVDDSNYFKIRDIAMMAKGTDNEFNVKWDGKLGAILITTEASYDVVGGELETDVTETIDVVENSTPIYVNGKQTAITAYNINGSSYFKIRDIADAVGFAVDWDGDEQMIKIKTK